MKQYSVDLTHLCLYILILATIIPDIGIKISVHGFTWTFFRICIVAGLLILIMCDKGVLHIYQGTYSYAWIILMLFWLFYGAVLLVTSSYSDKHNGILELLSVFNGMLLIYALTSVEITEEIQSRMCGLIIILLFLLLALAGFEILTGKHLWMSYFNDASNQSVKEVLQRHAATGIMYNVNDFSALITCMLPFCFYHGKRIVYCFCTILVFAVNTINDATLCNLAIIFGGLLYFIILRGQNIKKAIIRIIVCVISLIGIALTGNILITLLSGRVNIIDRIILQINNARIGGGSLYRRFIMYKDLIAVARSSMFLGIGPASLTSYFTRFASKSRLVNPHCLLLEILSQYGILVFAGFVILLTGMLITAIKCYMETDDKNERSRYFVAAELIIVYIMASFAPSSFIGYAYQWLIIAMICILLPKETKNKTQ